MESQERVQAPWDRTHLTAPGRRAPDRYRVRLTMDPPLELRVGGEHISGPIPDELRMEGEVTAEGERVRLELELSWSLAASKV